jgi:hypothetical protein
MGNLGLYEVITTEAKLAGGVDAWIKIIEDAAVAERSSEYFAKGAAVGALLAGAAAGATYAARAAWIRKHQLRTLAAEARRRLEADIAGRLAEEPIDDAPKGASDD